MLPADVPRQCLAVGEPLDSHAARSPGRARGRRAARFRRNPHRVQTRHRRRYRAPRPEPVSAAVAARARHAMDDRAAACCPRWRGAAAPDHAGQRAGRRHAGARRHLFRLRQLAAESAVRAHRHLPQPGRAISEPDGAADPDRRKPVASAGRADVSVAALSRGDGIARRRRIYVRRCRGLSAHRAGAPRGARVWSSVATAAPIR